MADLTGDRAGSHPAGDRAVSTAVGYTLNVALATILVAGLLTGLSGVVTDQRERVLRQGLEVAGQHLAADLMSVDRLARASDGGRVRLTTRFPDEMAGTAYRIRLRATGEGGEVVVSTADPDVSVAVPFENRTSFATTTVGGGPVTVRFDGSTIRMEGGE